VAWLGLHQGARYRGIAGKAKQELYHVTCPQQSNPAAYKEIYDYKKPLQHLDAVATVFYVSKNAASISIKKS
jgi:hypothetical protein